VIEPTPYEAVFTIASALDRADCAALYRAATHALRVQVQPIVVAKGVELHHQLVELGAWHGRSSAILGIVARKSGRPEVRAHSVDIWEKWTNPKGKLQYASLETWRGNMRRLCLDKLVRAWKVPSVAAADRWPAGEPVGLLFVDAVHTYEAVLADFDAWHPHLREGSLVCFHDYGRETFPGVTEAVDELTTHDGPLELLEVIESKAGMAICVVEQGVERAMTDRIRESMR